MDHVKVSQVSAVTDVQPEEMEGLDRVTLMLGKNGRCLDSRMIWIPSHGKRMSLQRNYEVRKLMIDRQIARYHLEVIQLIYNTNFKYDLFVIFPSKMNRGWLRDAEEYLIPW